MTNGNRYAGCRSTVTPSVRNKTTVRTYSSERDHVRQASGLQGQGGMETISNTQGSDGRSSGNSLLGNLAQRLPDGLRALGDSHGQLLAALVESSDDAIL